MDTRIAMPTPIASSATIRRRMQVTRRRDTPAELALRTELGRLGLRYRIDASPIPGTRRRADVVFRRAHVAVFVDGCFWHGCPLHGTWPKKNARWWRQKIETNRRRDADTDRQLVEAGWSVVRVWSHDDVVETAKRIVRLVRRQRSVCDFGQSARRKS